MYYIFSWEIFFLLLSFILFYIFKLEKKFISLLLNKITIYLPLTQEDYQNFLKAKKDKSQDIKGVTRTCEISEYSSKTTNEKFFQFDFVVLFYLCNFTYIFLNELKNFLYFLIHPIAQNVEENSHNNFNVISSFSLISLIYFVYFLLKRNVFKYGFLVRSAKIFYLYFICSFLCFLLINMFLPDLLGINYISVNKIVNDRLNNIIAQIKINFNFTFNSINDNISSPLSLKIFYSFIFALFTSILNNASIKLSYYDNFLLMTSDQIDVIQNRKNSSNLSYIVKFKVIINLLIFYLLLEPLFQSPLKVAFGENFKVIALKFYLSILTFFIVVELILGIYTYWYTAFAFQLQNYNEVIKFAREPTEKNFNYNSIFINYSNGEYWETLSTLFYIVFCPFLIFIGFYSRGDLMILIFSYGNMKEFGLKRYFYENLLYVILLAFAFSKGVIANIRLFFNIEKKHLQHGSLF